MVNLFLLLFFLVTFAFVLIAFIQFTSAPAARKKALTRLEAIREISLHPVSGTEGELAQRELFERIPAFQRFLYFNVPFVPKLQLFIRQAGLETDVVTLVLASVGAVVFIWLAGVIFSIQAEIVWLLIVFGAFLPWLVVAILRHRRFSRFAELFPDALDMLARAVRAGHAFTTGFEIIGKEMAEPVAGEFRTTFEQQNLGLPLRDALANLRARVPIPDVHIFVTAIQIQRDSGGNLAEILDNLAYVIRERFKLFRQVRAYTAEGRLSMYILVGLPPSAAVLLYFLRPDYMGPLFTDPLGNQMIIAGVVLQVLGYLVIRKITTLEV